MCVKEQVCILYSIFTPGSVSVVSRDRSLFTPGYWCASQMLVSQQMILHWSLTLFFFSLLVCDSIHAAVEYCGCVFEISVRSPETAPRNRSDALTAAHMLCDGVMFSLYPRWHAAALCICRTKWLYLSSLGSVRVCIGWRWGIPSGIWLMALKHCPDFLLLFCKV